MDGIAVKKLLGWLGELDLAISHCTCVILITLINHSFDLTIDRRMKVSLFLALFSANSRVLMSFSRNLYLFICSQMISSTHLWKDGKK